VREIINKNFVQFAYPEMTFEELRNVVYDNITKDPV